MCESAWAPGYAPGNRAASNGRRSTSGLLAVSQASQLLGGAEAVHDDVVNGGRADERRVLKASGLPLRRGDVVVTRKGGAGGYGDPTLRSLRNITADLQAEPGPGADRRRAHRRPRHDRVVGAVCCALGRVTLVVIAIGLVFNWGLQVWLPELLLR